jgi:plasmid stabilization system protein ParE
LEPFQLTGDAIRDIDAIWLHLLETAGIETAGRIVTALFNLLLQAG